MSVLFIIIITGRILYIPIGAGGRVTGIVKVVTGVGKYIVEMLIDTRLHVGEITTRIHVLTMVGQPGESLGERL